MVTEKYKLHHQAGDGAKCAFFFSPKGCRNGSTCKFLHTDPSVANGSVKDQKAKVVMPNVDVSSESSDEDKAFSPTAATAKQQFNQPISSEPNKKRKTPTNEDATKSIFAPHKNSNNGAKNTQLSEPTKNSSIQMKPTSVNKQKPSTTYQSFADTPRDSKTFTHPTEPQDTSIFASPASKKLKSSIRVKEELTISNHANFRQLEFPVASFSTVKKEVSPPKQKSMSSDDGSEEDTDFFPTLPTPKAPESIKWKDACLKSRAHSKYHSSYNFEKYKSYEAENGIAAMWIKAKPFGAWCRTNPQVIAIDCEMCETTCPLTGKIDGKALCRLSVINASNPEDILIDTLVKPDWPISDYRTRIHGIEPSHLDSVQFTLKHAQTFMMALCSEETVIIGHAVHNDLAALKMEHYCVADSSFLFEIKDEIGVCPSLRDVAMRVLSLEMPNIHDSVNDARISLQCLEEGYMKKGGSPSPIERYYPLRDRSVSKNNDSSLLVHRIPKICKVIHIQQLFLSQTSIQPEDIPEIEFAADKGKVMVTFQSPAHAKLAFEFISGVSSRDKGDKLQKKVYLKNGDYIVVRENCASKNPVGAE